MSPSHDPTLLPYLGLGTEAALRAVADALPDGLFTTDLAGKVTFWNRAAERITGWSRDEAIGRDCSILAGDAVNGCSCGSGPMRCGLAELGRSSKTCTLRARDGRLLSIVKNAATLTAPDGRPVGALESFTAAGEAAPDGSCDTGPTPPPAVGPCGLVGCHPSMLELYSTIDLVARSNATVMILGESGTGKECIAEAIHRGSARAEAPYVRVSCSALNENLLESELFGHVKGAFTGALRDRRGRFQEADGGTLLLDEIGDISPTVQVKLLRVIEQREIERVGDSSPIKVDVRLICATHRNLKAMVEDGRFRADLYFRLAVFPLRVPPLRERIEDLPSLANALLARLAGRDGRSATGIDPEALAVLRRYRWPGNVRELQNVLEFAALRAGGRPIGVAHLPEGTGAPEPTSHRVDAGGRIPLTRERILATVEACGGNRAEAARRLGISRVTLWKRLKKP